MKKTKATIILFLLFYYGFANIINIHPESISNNIQKYIDKASYGDTIVIHPGIYTSVSLVLQKSLHLIGINKPILDGDFKNELLRINADNVTIEGFIFRNSGKSGMNEIAGIRCIDANKIIIINNEIINCHFGIHISNSSTLTIQNNIIKGTPFEEQNTGNGIHLWKCNYANIFTNNISGHRDGIYFEFVTNSTIQDNISTFNIRYGLHFMFSHSNLYLCNEFIQNGAGVAVMYSKNVRMEENTFIKNWGASSYGILLKDISDSWIYNNKFLYNTIGIHFEGTSRIEVVRNEFQNNGWAIKVLASCMDNRFEHNNFISNSFDVATNGSLSLNTFSHNYWDKYEGYDLNHDGLGDVPFYPVNLYSMIVEQNPNTIILLRSTLIGFLDKAEKAIPSLTPENLKDSSPFLKLNSL
ncbi:MAG: nitrous oxide reductase family maturation protein NosD [Saprospiraceae bacterium]|nr:nitrous oxide reductase family maturation protein NosD [Saprospiraceae bacterium]